MMQRTPWIEHAKSIILITLILLSFILTGYLLYSAPSFEESREDSFLEPPFIGNQQHNNQSVYELVAPFTLITHKQGKHTYALPKEKEYNNLYNLIREAELTNFSLVEPTPDLWKTIFQTSLAVELNFSHESSIGQLDSFFKNTTLRDQPIIKKHDDISRIFFFIDPKTEGILAWFVSDHNHLIIQAQSGQINKKQFIQLINKSQSTKRLRLNPIPTNNKPPWVQENKDIPFSPIIYLPYGVWKVESFTYHLRQIDIENMKQWLFKDPNIAPVQLNNNELLYMYNDPNMYNDQIITYNKQKNSMVYTNAPTLMENQTMLIREELNEINLFIQRHRGWTNYYLVDQIQTEEHANEYKFRLFVNHLPVYWSNPSTKEVHPDTIQFQVKNSSVSKYVRSMNYLPTEPLNKKSVNLPDQKQFLSLLKQKKILLSQIKQLHPGYLTKQEKNGQVSLIPVWVVKTLDGKMHFFSSPSQEGN